MKANQIIDTAINILVTAEPKSSYGFASYAVDKIDIERTLDVAGRFDSQYHTGNVSLRIRIGKQNDKEQVLVFSAKKLDNASEWLIACHRPGKWVKELQKLWETLEQEYFSPIDDSEIFPGS